MSWPKLKHVAEIEAGQAPPSNEVAELAQGLPFIQGNAEFGTVSPSPRLECETAPKRVRSGDILLSVRAPVGALNMADQCMGIGRGLAGIRPEKADRRFVWWWLHTQLTRLDEVSTGTTYRAVTAEDVGNLSFPESSFEEQRRIADFLDAETARIDQLILLRNKQLKVMSEALASVATRLRDLDRQGLYHENRSSWETVALRRIVEGVQTGTTPTELLLPGVEAACIPWYTPAALDDSLGLGPADKSVNLADVGNVPLFPAGSILIVGIGESLGKVAHLDHDATGNQQLTAIKTVETVDRRFVAWQLFGAREEIRHWAQYSRVRILNNDVLKAFRIAMPPLKVQVALRKELDVRLHELLSFVTATARFSDLAAERRQALITAAVTGQIDVTTARRFAPSESVSV